MRWKKNESSVILINYIRRVKEGDIQGLSSTCVKGGGDQPPRSKGLERSEGGVKPRCVACRYSRKVWAPAWKK